MPQAGAGRHGKNGMLGAEKLKKLTKKLKAFLEVGGAAGDGAVRQRVLVQLLARRDSLQEARQSLGVSALHAFV